MGNRAIVKPKGRNVGVYLHWNGGIDSVTAFLEYCKLKGYRDFGGIYSDGYGMARFCQVVGNFFGGGLSLGIEDGVEESEEYAEWMDNGIYVIDGWDIYKRIGHESGREGYELKEMLLEIDNRQPESEQLGEKYILADIVDASELQIGDKVYIMTYREKPELHTVVGITNEGVPYIDLYDRDGDYSWNRNNHLKGKVRKEK
jgi:hypothetical protein